MIKKGLLFIFVFLLCLPLFNISSEDTEEYLLINGKKVASFDGSTYVTVPKRYQTQDREMRGCWVTTVFNIDVKKQNGTSQNAIKEYQNQFLSILDRMKLFNMNTIFFQVRPANDAFYQSNLNPWSEFLVGAGIDPGWDPLAWMINESHARGIQFQCWMNAFRITPSKILDEKASNYTEEELIMRKHTRLSSLPDLSFAKKHPEYVLLGEYDSKLILNPGEPAVQNFIVDTIMEIVENYDIDGLHFDDYFYLEGQGTASQTTNRNFAGGNKVITGNNTLNDLGTYERYLSNPYLFQLIPNLSLGDFRRHSLNNLMSSIKKAIDEFNKANNKLVEFGSKPAAVWRSNSEACGANERTSPEGSNTHCYAYSSYFDLFADTKHWVEAGYVDYIAPQVYYDFESSEVPYAEIVAWWANVVTQTNEARATSNLKPIKMYVAHGIYHIDESPDRFTDPTELIKQLKYNQKFPCIKGSAVFAYNDLLANTTNHLKISMDYFRDLWKRPALPLLIGEDDTSNLTLKAVNVMKQSNSEEYLLQIEKGAFTKGYVLYRVPKGEALDIHNPAHRHLIYYDLSEEGTKTFIPLKNVTLDDDLYLALLSNHNYLSEVYPVDLNNLIINTKPVLSTIIINEGLNSALPGSIIPIKFKEAVDAENDTLKYEIYVSINGDSGPFRFEVSDFEFVDGYVVANWQSFDFEINELCVKVTVSDGEFLVESLSNVIQLVKEKEQPEPIKPPKESKGCQNASVQSLLLVLVMASLIRFLKLFISKD